MSSLIRKVAPVSLLLTLAQSQTPVTTSLLLFGIGQGNYGASILAANPTATTYVVDCASGGSNLSQCSLAGTQLFVTAGPTVTPAATLYDSNAIVTASVAQTGEFSNLPASYHCQMSSAVPTACTVSASGFEIAQQGVDTDEYAYLAVTITAGLDKLASATSVAAAGAAPSTAATTVTSTASTAAITTTTASSTSTTVASTNTTSSSGNTTASPTTVATVTAAAATTVATTTAPATHTGAAAGTYQNDKAAVGLLALGGLLLAQLQL